MCPWLPVTPLYAKDGKQFLCPRAHLCGGVYSGKSGKGLGSGLQDFKRFQDKDENVVLFKKKTRLDDKALETSTQERLKEVYLSLGRHT